MDRTKLRMKLRDRHNQVADLESKSGVRLGSLSEMKHHSSKMADEISKLMLLNDDLSQNQQSTTFKQDSILS